MDETLRVQLEILGATFEQMPPSDDLMPDRNRRVERVGRPLTIVSGVGTGSLTGTLACYLRSVGRDVKLIGIQPFGSVTFDAEHTADPDMVIAGLAPYEVAGSDGIALPGSVADWAVPPPSPHDAVPVPARAPSGSF
ncbi:hypothetical protein [Nocardiopsis sp. CNT312]|uniref:hypothetical protein n=1 Tax=Nocardiopsis sp. CNT312 TaxID=1137268 RepID=UPI00048AB797|nr:hypothetical protein [Nocardiopsis sp. CNT312]